MKASTLFVISIVLLVGLGAVAGAKYIGLFEKKALPAPIVKEDSILVLVANSDLQEGIAITANDVRVRELHSTERQLYEDNKNTMMPPFVSAANMRVPKAAIRADQPLLRTYFEERQPNPVSQRIEFDMRAVNVAVPKERCAGGVIQLGEYVDVWLTAKISDPADPNRQFIRTARLDRDCKIIMKRNRLQTVLQSDPEGAPISFTLQANPYRAALIEYAQNKGQLSLMPVRNKNARPLNSDTVDSETPKQFTDMTSREYRDEDARVDSVRRGEYVVGDQDLERIFAVVPPPSPIPPIRVVEVKGIYPQFVQRFDRTTGAALPSTGPIEARPSGLTSAANFANPAAPTAPGECKTCGKNNKNNGGTDTISPSSTPPPPNGEPLPNGGQSFSPPR